MNYLKAVTGTAIGTLMGTSKVIGTVTLWERKRYGNGSGQERKGREWDVSATGTKELQ